MKGTWTTHFVESESNLVKVRNDISVLSASTLRTNPGTAYRMLKDFVPLNSDDDYIIQNGANSAVGRAVIEIAKAMDIKTINIIRDREDVDALKTELQEMGADIVWTEQVRIQSMIEIERLEKNIYLFTGIASNRTFQEETFTKT